MDTFIEQIVQKKKDASEWSVIVGVVIALLLICCLLFLFSGLVFVTVLTPFILIGAGYGGWYLLTSQNKEFEYCVTNGDIDIDCIIARRRRKRLVSVAGRKVESLLPYDAAKSTAGFQRVVMAAPSLQEQGLWCFTYHSKKNGHTLVVFQPDKRVLSALYSGVGKLVQMDAQRAAQTLGIELTGRRNSHGE
ncbi:MAG: hypothetical protein IJO76_01350 [Clostridia bacterium]|nr:hypothetical protein [Clostridia bacterium]